MQTVEIPDDLIKPAKAGQLLGVCIGTILRWIAIGRLPAWTLGPRGYRVSKADVLAQMQPVARKPAPLPIATRRQRKASERWTKEVLAANGIT